VSRRRPIVFRTMSAAFLALFALGAAPAPRRIVSLNMCADQLIVALADPDQIAGLTEWARDPALSFYAERATHLPYTHRSAEEVMALKPDVVIGAPYRTKAILAPLKTRGVRLVEMPRMESYASLAASIATVAAAVGHPERGAALTRRIDAQLAALGTPPGHGRSAAYYQRQGYLTGTGTLVDDMMRRAGLTNIAGSMGRSSLSQIGLEQMALARPDFLVMDDATRTAQDRGSAMLRHPLLDSAVPPSRHLYVPQALTVCATPGYPQAVAMLMRQVRAADAKDGSHPAP